MTDTITDASPESLLATLVMVTDGDGSARQHPHTLAQWVGENDQINRLQLGPVHGADYSRGADAWRPISIDGEKIGEVRRDAAGLTVFVGFAFEAGGSFSDE